MRRTILSLAFACAAFTCGAQENANGYPYSQVPFTAVKVDPNTFLGQRVKAAREVTIPLAFSKCQSEGRYDNFVKAAHPSSEYDVSKFMGFSFDDTDVYKTIEGASYVLQTYPDKKLMAYIDSVLDIVAAAQEPDGYLYTARTINPAKPHHWAGDKRWSKVEVLSHELYNLGHMVDAACAHYQATRSRKFLDIARRYADCVVREVGAGPGQATVVPGHQIAEMALARLFLLTGERKYLDQAKFFLDYRGKTTIKDIYSQSDKPVVDQKEAWGHAVRAGYMYAGMADVAALTGDTGYLRAIDAIWNNIVSRKYYLTGGVGARHSGEAFGADYELPNLTAYNETCAAIAQVYLNHRMFLLHGDAKYIDCLERTLYNGLISGMSIDGGRFFYPNPLSSDGKYRFNADGTTTRQPWFGCACCPSNLSRFIPSLPGYFYAVRDRDLYVNLFAGNTATISVDGKDVTLEQTTQYPWNGDVAIRIAKNKAKAFRMLIRIPGWVRGQVVPSDLYAYADGKQLGYGVTVNGNSVDGLLENGYLAIDRQWRKGDVVRIHFDMVPRMVKANDRVAADRGKVAVERGPLVYCVEWADNKGFNPHHIVLGKQPQFATKDGYAIANTEGDGKTFSVTAITAQAQLLCTDATGKVMVRDTDVTLIPYYAWNHRGAGVMDVWMADAIEGLNDK
ncbi:MAG: glycoside hydrolase family 127 protein [Prevotella sp.]|nr:glycoside hydrolase family 127 protein [Prevotella sp.]